jgi:hypothetical protein
MLPRSKTWQKWPQLAVPLVVAWSTCVLFATPSTGKAQDDQRLDDLTGVFTVTIAKPDIPHNLADGPTLEGIWSIDLGSDGAFSIARLDVGQIVSGTYEASATTLTFNEWNGLIGCAVGEEDGGAVYGWRRSESALTLTPIREACPERIALLSTRPLGSDEACAGSTRPEIAPSIDAAGDTRLPGTPEAEAPRESGVTAQEGLSDVAETEMAVDGLLGQANGCWATGDPQSFLALHSDAVVQQLVFAAPPDVIVAQLRQAMMEPASFERIGDVNLSGSDQAWAYVQLTFADQSQPLRVDFVNDHGQWLFDTYIPMALSSPLSSVNLPS